MQSMAPPTSEGAAHLRRSCARTVAGCVVAVVALWGIFGRTRWGQDLDNDMLAATRAVSWMVTDANDDALHVIGALSVLLCVAALVLVVALRRRPLLGAVAALAVGGAALTTEALKAHVMVRPDLASAPLRISNRSFPSGHATVAMALAVALIMVTPRRWRTATAVGVATWVAFISNGVLAAGWHRPSDVVAGYAVALAWWCTALLAFAVLDLVPPAESEEVERAAARRLVPVVLTVLALGLVVVAASRGRSAYDLSGATSGWAAVVVDPVAVAVIWWFSRLLGRRSPVVTVVSVRERVRLGRTWRR